MNMREEEIWNSAVKNYQTCKDAYNSAMASYSKIYKRTQDDLKTGSLEPDELEKLLNSMIKVTTCGQRIEKATRILASIKFGRIAE